MGPGVGLPSESSTVMGAAPDCAIGRLSDGADIGKGHPLDSFPLRRVAVRKHCQSAAAGEPKPKTSFGIFEQSADGFDAVAKIHGLSERTVMGAIK